MTDTIDLLEMIGSDASLRYASADELNSVLEPTQASPEFEKAVVLGDGAPLRRMLGYMHVEEAPQTQAVALLELDWSEPKA